MIMNKESGRQTEAVIITDKLTKNYGVLTALNEFSLTVEKRDLLALLGANGAGKTTLIRILLGLSRQEAPPDGGTANVLGYSSEKLPRSAKEKIGFISDDSSPMPWASGSAIADFYSNIYPEWDAGEFVRLTDLWHLDVRRKLHSLSKGQKRLMEFALVLSYRPQLLVMDEPFNGLDAVNRILLMDFIKKLRLERDITILYTTHVLEEVEKIADRIVIMRNGMNIFNSTVDAMEKSVENTFRECYEID